MRGGPTIVASYGPVRDHLTVLTGQDGGSSPYVVALPSRLSSHLVQRPEAQDIVLVVSSISARQQNASTRLLLQHATHEIVAHEFTRRPSVAT